MKESSVAVSFSLSDIFSGIFSSESSDAVSEAQSFFGPDDKILFDRGADPAHPYDTAFQDYFSLDYLEDGNSPVDSVADIANDTGESRSLVVHMDKVEELPNNHPVRRMAELTPEPDNTGLSFGASPEDHQRVEEELKEVIRESMMENEGQWDDTWERMEEDVEAVKETVFEYNDARSEHNEKLEVRVDDATNLPDSYTNALTGTEIFHGENFDAELKNRKAFIQFHDSGFYTSPENILSEDEYIEVRNGEKDYQELNRDQKAVFEIYRASPIEKTFNL